MEGEWGSFEGSMAGIIGFRLTMSHYWPPLSHTFGICALSGSQTLGNPGMVALILRDSMFYCDGAEKGGGRMKEF